MSDWIEKDGKKYFEAGYLELANNNAKRRGEVIQGWKDWHREISKLLGCEFVEVQVTKERVEELMDQLKSNFDFLGLIEKVDQEVADQNCQLVLFADGSGCVMDSEGDHLISFDNKEQLKSEVESFRYVSS